MSYTTINDLPERLIGQLVGSENLLLTDPDYSYRVTLDTLNEKLIELSAGTYQELTNKVIDDVSNYVHANAIHFVATATQTMPKGTPVNLVAINYDTTNVIYVAPATQSTEIVGIVEDGINNGESGEIMVFGILNDFDTSAWSEGDSLYVDDTGIVNSQPATGNIQYIGRVLAKGTSGKIMVTGMDPFPDAREIAFEPTGTDLSSTNVQDAIVEVDTRVNDLEEIVFQQADAPTEAEGASDGDIWMDTTTNTLNVYREYPINTGVYRWEPLIYKWDDVVDGGSW